MFFSRLSFWCKEMKCINSNLLALTSCSVWCLFDRRPHRQGRSSTRCKVTTRWQSCGTWRRCCWRHCKIRMRWGRCCILSCQDDTATCSDPLCTSVLVKRYLYVCSYYVTCHSTRCCWLRTATESLSVNSSSILCTLPATRLDEHSLLSSNYPNSIPSGLLWEITILFQILIN